MTGEDWNGIMHDLATDDLYDGESCVSNQSYDDMQRDGIKGCGSSFAYPYFISFFIFIAIVILDLSIGVFINALSDARKDNESAFNRDIMEEFLELWSDYDPDTTGWITADQLVFLFFELPVPLGMGKVTPNQNHQYEFDSKLSFKSYLIGVYRKMIQENKTFVKAMTKSKHNQHQIVVV